MLQAGLKDLQPQPEPVPVAQERPAPLSKRRYLPAPRKMRKAEGRGRPPSNGGLTPKREAVRQIVADAGDDGIRGIDVAKGMKQQYPKMSEGAVSVMLSGLGKEGLVQPGEDRRWRLAK